MSFPSTNPSFSESKELKVKKKTKLKKPFLRSSSVTGLWHRIGNHKSFRLNSLPEYTHGKFRLSVIRQAEELRSKLDPNYPSFIKCLLRSHVTGGFWLGLPAPFCQLHLPHEDTFMTLENQNGKPYKAKYLVRKTGLSGGWKGFAISERLLVGDVLVFQLVSATKFKVYVVREQQLTEVDGAVILLNLDTHGEPSNHDSVPLNFTKSVDMHLGIIKQNKRTHQASSLLANARCQDKKTHSPETNHRIMQPPENSENNSAEVSSIFTNGFQSPEPVSSSNGVESFENFNTEINELLKDYELPRHIKWSYYKLCCTQNTLLHAHIPKEINHVFIAGIIIETVSIADALRNCELSTSKEEFAGWDKIFDSFERLGMNVSFLRAHLDCLQKIAYDPEVAMCRQEYSRLCSENARAGDEIKSLEARLSEMKKVYNQHAANIENLQTKIENHELKFQDQVSAPW